MTISKLFTVFLFVFPPIISFSLAAASSCTISPPPLFFRLSNCTIAPNNDFPNGVDSWGLKLSIGLPAQELCSCPSMSANNTVVVTQPICLNATYGNYSQCISDRGGVFDIQEATSGYTPSQEGLAPDDVWRTFNPAFAGSGSASVQFSEDVSFDSYPIALAEVAPNSSLSQLGLANTSVFLREVVSAGFATIPAYSLLAGSQAQQPRDGHLIIGAYDANSLAGPFYNFTISNTTTAGDRVCSLQVEVDSIILNIPGQSGVELNTGGTPMSSCLEPLDNLFRLPGTITDLFQEHTGLKNDYSLVSDQLLIVEPGLVFNSTFNGSLTFTIKNGPVVEVPNEEITQILRGIDRNGKRVLQNNVTVVNIFNTTAPEGTATLGKVLLSQLYLTVNYPLQQFQLALAVTEAAGAVDLRPFENANSIICQDSARDDAYIGVIVLGCVIGVILIAFCAWLLRRRMQKNEDPVPKDLRDDSDQGSRGPHQEETMPAAENARQELEDRSQRLGSVASVSTEGANLRIDRQESISTIMSNPQPEPTRYPNIFPTFPPFPPTVREVPEPDHELSELDQGVRPPELAGKHREGDLSPLSDRGPG